MTDLAAIRVAYLSNNLLSLAVAQLHCLIQNPSLILSGATPLSPRTKLIPVAAIRCPPVGTIQEVGAGFAKW